VQIYTDNNIYALGVHMPHTTFRCFVLIAIIMQVDGYVIAIS